MENRIINFFIPGSRTEAGNREELVKIPWQRRDRGRAVTEGSDLVSVPFRQPTALTRGCLVADCT